MDPLDVEKVIASLKIVDVSEDVPVEVVRLASLEVSKLLTSETGVNSLKKNPKDLEVVFPIYVRIIFHPDHDVADRCFVHRDLFMEIFQSRLPGIKKESWYKNFEAKTLLKFISSLESRIAANDKSWVPIWIWVASIVINSTLQTPPLNKLLSMTEFAFKKGKEDIEILDSAWTCWVALIDAFGRFPEILMPNRIMKLLLQPLRLCSTVSKHRISTWVHLIKVKGLPSSPESVKYLVEPFCHAMCEPLERAMSRHFPNQCTEALIEILSLEHVVEHCLPDIIGVFGVCVNSRPSSSLIERLAAALVKAINDTVEDGKSYKLWKALLEQYNNCTESPILSQACQIIFSDINFLRWVDSGTVGSNDITDLMCSSGFRDKVLPRSVKALNFEERETTPTKKKSRKGSCEDVWSNYCEAFISWLLNQSPPCSKESDKPDASPPLKDSSDCLAVQCLLLQPLQSHTWNQTVSKTWARLCEACHSQKLLHKFVKSIFEAIDEPNFHVQKSIDVSDCLYRADDSFCKHSLHLLETISSAIKSMEFQSLLDTLNLLETAVIHPENSAVIGKICKSATEKSADYDQLNAHKIRTKVGKIMRKLDNSSSAEKEKPAKTQRTPFRTQSNFLQRLAKAEEKNRTKSQYLTSIFSSAEKGKNGIENGDVQPNEGAVAHSQNNGISDDSKNDDSEAVPIISLPSVLKSTPVREDGVIDGIVAEKENVILPSVISSPQASSPRLKITNAREVKTVDVSSPAVAKKPKPIAGQKSTPKKATPSKVSYFDDDANDCVMVPPKPKTTPLTEHQMEMMSKRRTDIPALYQDLSQDTQTSQPVAIQEVTIHVSPRPVQESQGIVPGTPSPEDRPAASTPDRRKSAGKSTSSAKKLDFNGLSTPPSKITPLDSSFRKMSPVPEQGNNTIDGSVPVNATEDADPAVDGLSSSNSPPIEPKLTPEKPESRVKGEKSKKKRKSEPTKFSPKLTRSKKSLKSVTPDAKMIKSTLPVAESKSPVRKSPDPDAKSPNTVGVKNIEPAKKSIDPKSREPDASSQTVTGACKTENSQSTREKNKFDEESSVPADKSKPIEHNESEELSSQPADDLVLSSQNTPKSSESAKTKKSRKRKADDSLAEGSKKTEEDGPSAKKSSSSKKKKPFKLGSGGNLENWLVKTERVPTPVPEPDVKPSIEKMESGDAVIPQSKDGTELLPEDPVVDLNNSEEIVPCTQELDPKPVMPVLKSGAEFDFYDVVIKTEVYYPQTDTAFNENHSPPKSEGSILEKLAHESPNDDIDLIISPSKRQRRASSVFRGEGDTYLLKDKIQPTPQDEPEEELKSPVRATNKCTSPSSKKRLQPAGGRSAKMLRLATGSTTPDENVSVVTPVRRRESIAPVKYGENWPKGHMEDWVACAPVSPYASPFRSALKKPLSSEENATPKRTTDTLASPLLSSAKRKRVVFLDPPVTRGLIYEVGSPCGSVHHADVPQGSPYPTWKGDEDLRRGQDDPKTDISPSKRDAERLSLLETTKENREASPSRQRREKLKSDLKTHPEVSDEVRQLLDPPEPSAIVPSPEPDMGQFQEKFHLTDDFMTELSESDEHVRSMLIKCFECVNMVETVDSWKLSDCRLVCQMPHSFLNSVKNSAGETLTDILSSAVFTAPTDKVPPALLECSAQTELPLVNSTQTNTAESKDGESQTVSAKMRSVDSNTDVLATSSSSTQADLTLPSVEDLTPLLKRVGTPQALLFLSDCLRILSSLSKDN